ncbi:protein disulfide-isomerase-like [Malania oleifera]|uniref:protein disulfide-isomerase-like n=1 Tax=Malania oleifera TaxID=397392 RepID=UPI0025ADCD91|nr:protein disulfide-isomerase-like [Malania oleifera]
MASGVRVKALTLFFFIALVLCTVQISSCLGVVESAGSGGGDQSESKEVVITFHHSNFSDIVSKYGFIVVEFYSPRCGHCKKLAPEYEKAASILSRHDPPVVLAKVDAHDRPNKRLASEFEVKGFPTLKIFRNGGKVVQDYKGPRDAYGIVAYLKRQSGPASLEIKSMEDASSRVVGKKIVVVGVFPKFSGEEFENFTTLAEKLRTDYDFGHTLDAKLLPRGETSVAGPTIRLFKPFDELFVDSQDFHVDAMEKFVEESSMPLVAVFDKDQSNHPFVLRLFNSPHDRVILVLNFSSEFFDTFKSNYHDVAEQYKGKGLNFLLADLEASQQTLQYFGLKADQVPVIIIQSNAEHHYIKSSLEPDQIAPWIKEYKDGNLLPFIKSEPIPEVNNTPVKVVVANSLQDIVLNSGKYVLLEFYAPWCEHCKKLAPILEEVAVSYESDPDIIIAKIDATANDIPKDIFKVEAYPTLYFKSKAGNFSLFDGDRTKEGVIDFIQKNRGINAQQDSVKDEL